MAIFALGKTASAGTRIMLASIAVLTIVLIALTTVLLREPPRKLLVDDIETTAVAEPSHMATYAFSLAQFVRERCGDTPTDVLAAASEAEKTANPAGYAAAVAEAAARAKTITTGKSCDYIISEIQAAEMPPAAAAPKSGH